MLPGITISVLCKVVLPLNSNASISNKMCFCIAAAASCCGQRHDCGGFSIAVPDARSGKSCCYTSTHLAAPSMHLQLLEALIECSLSGNHKCRVMHQDVAASQ